MVRFLALLVFLFVAVDETKKPVAVEPRADLVYTADGQMKFPTQYREWVYLTSGLGMSYTPGAVPEHPAFDNVFVNPASYRTFVATGTWPDKTVMVLELRGSERHASIDQRGQSQSPEVMGVECM